MLTVDHDDKDMWDIATNVPKVSKPVAVVALILNMILPGCGTMMAACLTDSQVISKTQMFIAFVQTFTAFFLIGYVFALVWSVLIIIKAFKQPLQGNQEQSNRI